MKETHFVKHAMAPARPWRLIIVASLMVLFGLAEVVTSFTHDFFGITTTSTSIYIYSASVIGLCYMAAGLLILTLKKWAAALAIVLLGVDIVGRITLVATDLFPTDSLKNTFSIIVGTLIAALFAIYIGWKWRTFR